MTPTFKIPIRAGVRSDESDPRRSVGHYSETGDAGRDYTLHCQLEKNLYSLRKHCDSIVMNIFLALFVFVFQSTLLQAKICQIKQLVSKPVRQSYLENVRKTVTYPCCTNIACDPPVCKKVGIILCPAQIALELRLSDVTFLILLI